jgi:hypothetical protein
VKTNRRDATTLAKLHRAGELTPVCVPDAMRTWCGRGPRRSACSGGPASTCKAFSCALGCEPTPRKRIEEAFASIKTIAGQAKTSFRDTRGRLGLHAGGSGVQPDPPAQAGGTLAVTCDLRRRPPRYALAAIPHASPCMAQPAPSQEQKPVRGFSSSDLVMGLPLTARGGHSSAAKAQEE